MLQRLRQISISSSLRGAFLTGALLTLIVSSVSLYSWHEQSSQIRYSLDEYFPRIHAAFLIEGNLNLVVDQLNEFLLAPNTTVRLQLRNQIIQHLDKIERLSQVAVVGQTMTTLAHEINQPLNALSMYLFTAGRAIEQGQAEQARTTLSKAEGLINRIDAIIRSLRQFTRRAELETPLHPVDLRQTFTVAWELLAMRHKPQQGTLVIPDDTVWILGDEVRVHQVLVNVLSNALDACPHAAQITVSWQIQGGRLCVLIADNGPGWPAALLPSLLKPFTTSKTVGLGIFF